MDLRPEELSVQERYKLLIGGIVPRPIALVSTVSVSGALNLAPFSFFNAVGSNPMLLSFCPANRADGEEKDSLRNAKPAEEGGVGEFVVNIAGEAIAAQLSGAAEELPHGESEFDLTGLTPAPSAIVAPPRVEEAPLSFECRTLSVHRFAPGEPAGANLILGEVVHVHAADGLVDERMRVDPDLLNAFGRMGGRSYCRTTDRFDLALGRNALDQP